MKGRVLVGVQFACLIALVLIPGSGAIDAARSVGSRILVAACGLVLALAFIALRESVTVFPEPRPDAPFITDGIYGHVRHPMYLAVLMFGAAMVLTKWTPLSACLWLALFADLWIKYHYEDRLLAARWPQALLYQHAVGALLPRRPGRLSP